MCLVWLWFVTLLLTANTTHTPQNDSDLQYHIDSEMNITIEQVEWNELNALVNTTEGNMTNAIDDLRDLGLQNVTFDQAIEDLGLDKDAVEFAITMLPNDAQAELREIFAAANNSVLEQMKEYLWNANLTEGPNGTWILPSSSRRLISGQSRANPDLRTVPDDTIQSIRQNIERQRRLLEASDGGSRPSNDFAARLDGHIQVLEGHLRRLASLDGCDPGTTDLRCAADKMQELADKIVDKGNKVINKLDVFNPILEGIASGEATMTDVESMVSTIYTAADAATMIPSVGSSFTPVKNFMNPINTGIGGIKDKLSSFQDSVGSLWSSSIGHLESIIDSFDTGDMSVVLGISDTFASL